MIPIVMKRDKWTQYRILRKGPSLAKRLPKTRLLRKNNLSKMLHQYQSVVVKPRDGRYGRDILFIHRNGAKSIRIQHEDHVTTMKDTNQLLQLFHNKTRIMDMSSKDVCSLPRFKTAPSISALWFNAKEVLHPPGT